MFVGFCVRGILFCNFSLKWVACGTLSLYPFTSKSALALLWVCNGVCDNVDIFAVSVP